MVYIFTCYQKLRKKGKSAHDLLSDPRLSSVPVSLDASANPDLARVLLEADREAQERRRRRELASSDDDPETAKTKRMYVLQLRFNMVFSYKYSKWLRTSTGKQIIDF